MCVYRFPFSSAGNILLVVPDFNAASQDSRIASLKSKCEDSKPIGLARVSPDENMVVYEDFGCFIDRHGVPVRNGFVICWECKALRFAERRHHILLFSPEFVEVREKSSGKLVQVIEGQDIRLLNAGMANAGASDDANILSDAEPILMCRLGKRNDVHGQSVELLELLKTNEIAMSPINNFEGPNGSKANAWSEWDMP